MCSAYCYLTNFYKTFLSYTKHGITQNYSRKKQLPQTFQTSYSLGKIIYLLLLSMYVLQTERSLLHEGTFMSIAETRWKDVKDILSNVVVLFGFGGSLYHKAETVLNGRQACCLPFLKRFISFFTKFVIRSLKWIEMLTFNTSPNILIHHWVGTNK